jgi:single-stranded-DNA-specific exonuclease
VIGIVASRLIETYYRPTLVLQKVDKYAASARSVKDVYNALEACSEHLEQFEVTCTCRNDDKT